MLGRHKGVGEDGFAGIIRLDGDQAYVTLDQHCFIDPSMMIPGQTELGGDETHLGEALLEDIFKVASLERDEATRL